MPPAAEPAITLPASPRTAHPSRTTPSQKRPSSLRLLTNQLKEYSRLRIGFVRVFLERAVGITRPQTLDPALLAQGLTLVLPGIESESVFTYGMCDGLHAGGVPGAIRVFNWGLPFPGGYLANLTRIDRNRRRAQDLANEITRYQVAYPHRPVHLVAQSGGAGVAVFAVEALPPGSTVDGIVLLGGALSPTYNLAPALAKTKKGILNSHSARDSVILNWGTRLFGTTDRQFTKAAGCAGFHLPADATPADQRLYEEKLTQLAWCVEWADTCHHFGGHISSGGEKFLAQHIAPWVKSS